MTISGKDRFLRGEEIELLCALLREHSSRKSLLANVEKAKVRDLKDGQMGSVEFVGDSPDVRRMSRCVAEADYVDSDGVSVSIAVNIDQEGNLFEIDMWKVDFNRLIQYPASRTIRNVRYSG
jgi:hypothetical protein